MSIGSNKNKRGFASHPLLVAFLVLFNTAGIIWTGHLAYQVVTGGGGGGTPGSSPGGTVTVNPLNNGAKFNGHRVKDATTIVSSGVITFPNNDGNFTSADIGKIIFCTTSIIASTVLNIGTISTVNSTQSITSTGLSASNQTATGICAWGTDDSTALNTAWNNAANIAANSQAAIFYQMPSGITFTHTCLWNSTTFPNDSTMSAYVIPTIQGAATGSTIIIPVPMISQGGTFDLTTCPTGGTNFPPMFGPAGSASNSTGSAVFKDFTIDGMGNNLTGISMGQLSVLGSGNVATPAGLTFMTHVSCVGFGALATNLVGLRTGGIQSVYQETFLDGCGNGILVVPPGSSGSQPPIITFRDVFSGDITNSQAVTVSGTGLVTLNSYGSTFGPSCGGFDAILVTGASAIFNSYGDGTLQNGCNGTGNGVLHCATNAVCHTYGSKFFSQAPGQGCAATGGAILYATGTICQGAGGANFDVNVDSTSKFVNLGGNILHFSGDTNNIAGTWAGPGNGDAVQGGCTGTATAATTLGLYGTGANVVATTCTSALIGTGIRMTQAGTLLGVVVTATHAGVNASSGVVTVLKNGGATTTTCTVGTTTACQDFSHAAAYAAGDLISINFTTQAVEVLAGVQATVALQ